MIDSIKRPAMGKAGAAARCLRRLMSAIWLIGIAAGAAYASTRSVPVPLPTSATALIEGLDALNGLDFLFAPQLDRTIFEAANVMVSASKAYAGILPLNLNPEKRSKNYMTADEQKRGPSDSTTLALVGLGFALAGSVGRRPNRALRRRKVTESGGKPPEMAVELVF